MKNFLPILKKSRLMSGLNDEEISSALVCLKTNIRQFKKDEVVFYEGDKADYIGIVLLGGFETKKTDYNGNTNIISRLNPSDLIAAVAAYSADKTMPFDIVCSDNSQVLSLSTEMLIRPCCNLCSSHTKIIENMLKVFADKNIQLTEKIDILTKRSIREKLLSYLYSQSKKSKSNVFSLPLNRRQMAEYLSVDRSALSRELSNMQSEGLLEFCGNSFKLL